MATTFDEIEDRALIEIRDYRIDALYNSNPTDFQTYMDGFLIRAIPRFTACTQDIDSYNSTTREFAVTLSNIEQEILATYTAIVWFTNTIQDITQMNQKFNNKEMKMYSESQNLKEKKSYLNDCEEKVEWLVEKYSISNMAV